MLSIVGSVYRGLHSDTVHGARMTCDKYQANLCLSTMNLKKSCFFVVDIYSLLPLEKFKLHKIIVFSHVEVYSYLVGFECKYYK